MALRIMRLDKREESRAGEIVKDWRKWATDNGYIKKGSLDVEQGHMNITLETWEHPSATEDTYLFYHPEKRGTYLRWLKGVPRDRKSTRLNSSHSQISYAVF